MRNPNFSPEFEQGWQTLPPDTQKVVQLLAAFWIFKHALSFPPDVENSDSLPDFFPYLPKHLQEELYYFVQFLALQHQTPISEEGQTEWDTNYLLLQRLVDPNPVRHTWEDLQGQTTRKLIAK